MFETLEYLYNRITEEGQGFLRQKGILDKDNNPTEDLDLIDTSSYTQEEIRLLIDHTAKALALLDLLRVQREAEFWEAEARRLGSTVEFYG